MRFWLLVTILLALPSAAYAGPQNESPKEPEQPPEDQAAQPPEQETTEPSEDEAQPSSDVTTEESTEVEEKESNQPTPEEQEEAPKIAPSNTETETKKETDAKEQTDAKKETELKLHWRDDPKTLRHPGSYIGFGAGYTNVHTWFTPQEEEFAEEMSLGPFHSWQAFFRVGDAFKEWFAIGFQINMTYGKDGESGATGGFTLLLDTTFYPWRGLGIRPSVGLGFSYAQGKEEYEFGYGGPGCLSLAITYEFRISRLFAIAPVAQVFWIAGEDFNGLYLSGGIEFVKWFDTPTG